MGSHATSFGVILTGLSGVAAAPRVNVFLRHTQSLHEGAYERVTIASGAEVEDSPGLIVGRLVADLMLALGTVREYDAYFSPPPDAPIVE